MKLSDLIRREGYKRIQDFCDETGISRQTVWLIDTNKIGNIKKDTLMIIAQGLFLTPKGLKELLEK